MTKQFFKVLSLAAFISLSACADYYDLEDIQPINAVDANSAISDLQSAQAARAGVYSSLQDNNFDRWLAGAQYFSDEADWTGTFPTRQEFFNLNVLTSNGTMAGMFSSYYNSINDANNVLEVLPGVEDVTINDENRNSILAEARFVRAISYLDLTQNWGDVPLVLTPTRGVGEELNVPTSSRDQVLAQIIEDFTFAANNLEPSQSLGATPAAANGFLARIALYQERWADAEQLASGAIGGDLDAFIADNPEDELFSIKFISTDGNSLAFFYGPASLNGRLSISPSATLMAAFEEGDTRAANTFAMLDDGTPYGVKYPDFSAAGGSQTSPIRLLRGSEMALIIAEAKARQGDFDGASDWINVVRNRAGLDDITLDADNFVDAILQERFVEFALEGQQRLWDLRRTGKALEVLGPIGYEACDAVWPLPQREIDRNTALVQNNCCNC